MHPSFSIPPVAPLIALLTLAEVAQASPQASTEGQAVPLEGAPLTSASAPPPTSASASTPASASPTPPYVLGGYTEGNYQWNFNNPSNGLTNFRGFDNRHDSFTLPNVALDARWDDGHTLGRVTLQVGHTPSTYFLSEPSSPASGAAANSSGVELWKYVQQAHAGYRFERGFTLTAGLFLSPIGPESIAVHDNWNWSRSNLFFGLPFYHTGLQATFSPATDWAVTVAGFNGWNSVVDNNAQKSISTQLAYTTPDLAVSVLYFGGVERAEGAPEGPAWRHLFDAHATWDATPRLSLRAHVNSGFEHNAMGVSAWAAGALYARILLIEWLSFSARGDLFHEHAAETPLSRASPIFWPVPWVSSATATLDFRPQDRVSFCLEFRHDHAGGDLFYGGTVEGDGAANPYLPNRSSQDTLTVGATTWF